jgi:hypothetical protein
MAVKNRRVETRFIASAQGTRTNGMVNTTKSDSPETQMVGAALAAKSHFAAKAAPT